MELYNSLIKDTKAFFDGKNPQRWSYNERDCWTDLGSSELVLQKDAAYELGAMGKGSANYVLFTSNAELGSMTKSSFTAPTSRISRATATLPA